MIGDKTAAMSNDRHAGGRSQELLYDPNVPTPTHAEQARTDAAKQATPYRPKFFTAHEYATVVVLVDLIIPRDERSGSATDAGVPEFMDFMMVDQPRRKVAMRGGLPSWRPW